MDTKLDRPMPRDDASARMAMPSPPDWEAKPMRPGTGAVGAKVAFMDTPGSVLTTPKQFGPTTRMPATCAMRTSSCWATAPSPPASAKPAEITTSAPTPLAPQSSTTDGTAAAGTATTARSTSPGTARTVGQHGIDATEVAAGLTGYTGPAKPPATRLRSSWWPM